MSNFKNKNLKEIPIFTASDDNYMPFIAVTLESMLTNCSNNYNYSIKILHTGVSEESIEKIKKYNRDNVDIEFVDMKERLEQVMSKFHTCIYYTQTTYYRLFISELYPQYDKIVYIDCDVAVLGDISKLYHINIGDNLIGATTDEFVMNYPSIQNYFTDCLGISGLKNYFNAGVLIMNLHQFRLQNFEAQFIDLLGKYKFVVQDQDYLNVLCKNKVYYIDGSWDKMPCIEDIDVSKVNLVHYNLIWKPWHAEVPYGEEFWKYADRTEYASIIRNIRLNYSADQYQKDVDNFNGFMEKIIAEIDNPYNYYNLFLKPEEGGSTGSFQFQMCFA